METHFRFLPSPFSWVHYFPTPSTPFPPVKWMISPSKAVHFPNPSATVPPLKYPLSPGKNEHNKKHHATQKFGRAKSAKSSGLWG